MGRWVLCLFCFLFFWGCSSPSPTEKKPLILTSIDPYAFLVERIAGDTVSVVTLVPSGANPHIFEPSPRDASMVTQACAWVCAGESFETKILSLLGSAAPRLRVLDMSSGVDLIRSHSCCMHEAADRHIWMSPTITKDLAGRVTQMLCELFPQNKSLYERNLSVLVEELVVLHLQIQEILSSSRNALLVLSHPSLGYFCKEYHLEQLSVEVEGKDPLPRDIAHLLEHVRGRFVKKVFVQQGYNNKGAERVAERLGLSTCEIDPYSKNYIENLRFIASSIAEL